MRTTFIPEGEYMTVEDMSVSTGISEATIKRRCARGDLQEHSLKVGRQWLIQVPKPTRPRS